MNRFLRHLAPFLLLASYLPMVVLSSTHVHHETIDAHDDCLQCVGHIGEVHHHDHDCLFCVFLGQSYLPQDKVQQVVQFSAAECFCMRNPQMAKQLHHGVAQLRAPPVA